MKNKNKLISLAVITTQILFLFSPIFASYSYAAPQQVELKYDPATGNSSYIDPNTNQKVDVSAAALAEAQKNTPDPTKVTPASEPYGPTPAEIQEGQAQQAAQAAADTAGYNKVTADKKQMLDSSYNGGTTGGATNPQAQNYSSATTGCVGKIVGKYVANYLGTYITGLAGGAMSGITTWVGGLFGGSGSSGSSGSSAGGGTGGAAGGGAAGAGNQTVPTRNDKAQPILESTDASGKKINKQTAASEAQQNFLTPLAVCIANELVQQMTASTIQWINNGFKNPDGTTGPAFVSNPKQFFLGIADREAGGFFQSLGPIGSMLCKPFDIKVRLALLGDYRGDNSNQCTLTSIKTNMTNFGKRINGDNGNYWNDFFELTQKDNNNSIGSYFRLRDELANGVKYNQDANRLEVTIGRGFLDMKTCLSYKPGTKVCDKWKVTTPGAEVQSSLDRVLTIQGQRINIANSFDDIVSALIGQLLKQAMGGLSGK